MIITGILVNFFICAITLTYKEILSLSILSISIKLSRLLTPLQYYCIHNSEQPESGKSN